jgi:ACS family pantothenate transporter-like MFS transporter
MKHKFDPAATFLLHLYLNTEPNMSKNNKDPLTETVRGGQDHPVTSDSEASVVAVLQDTPKRSWKSYVWDTFDKSPEERRFLFKLDCALMTLASLGYFIKYLDQVRLHLD